MKTQTATHTLGPWEVRYGHDSDADRVYGIYAANGERVVETDSGVYPPETPDARLIAAAPEMLAAIKATLAMLEQNVTVNLRAKDVVFNGDVRFIEDTLRAALAKVSP